MDAAGLLRKHGNYDAFGKVTGEQFYAKNGSSIAVTHAEAVDQLFYYQGRGRDSATGLQKHGQRWYDPHTGRWLSEDPTGFDGGDVNLYRAFGNSPDNFTDPTGTTQAGNPLNNLNTGGLNSYSTPKAVDQYYLNQNLKNYANPVSTGSFRYTASAPPTSGAIQTQVHNAYFGDLNRQSIGLPPIAQAKPDLYPSSPIVRTVHLEGRNRGQEVRAPLYATADASLAARSGTNDILSSQYYTDGLYTVHAGLYYTLGGVLGSVQDVITPPTPPTTIDYHANGRYTLHDGEGLPTAAYANQAMALAPPVLANASRPTGSLLLRTTPETSAAVPSNYPTGTFSITTQKLETYPTRVPQPQGPFRLLDDVEYDAARRAADVTNNAIREQYGLRGSGLDIHEVQPVKFDGSPTDFNNKVLLDEQYHRQIVTPWWNQLQREIERPR